MEDRQAHPPRSLGAAWTTAVVLAVTAAAATWLANEVIVGFFAGAARPNDLLFELLPHIDAARWLTLVALVAGPGVFLWTQLRAAPEKVPAAAAAIALMYLLRAGMMVLTPLAPAYGDGTFLFPLVQYGTFPSGHTALATLLALLVPDDHFWVRRFLWSMVAVMIAGLLLARGHYSIDIVGGLLLAYFVATIWRRGRLFSLVARFTGR